MTITWFRRSAFHSSSATEDNGISQSVGRPSDVIVAPTDSGKPIIHQQGNTDILSDMTLLDGICTPDVVIAPVGDRFTMGLRTSAPTVERFPHRTRAAVPCQRGTFLPPIGSAEAFTTEMADAEPRMPAPDREVPSTLQRSPILPRGIRPQQGRGLDRQEICNEG